MDMVVRGHHHGPIVPCQRARPGGGPASLVRNGSNCGPCGRKSPAPADGRVPDSSPWSAHSARLMCSPRSPTWATPSRSSSTARGSVPRRCSASRSGRTCPRPRSCCRRRRPGPITGCGSSPRAGSSRSPGIRRWAAATPGCPTAAHPHRGHVVVQECEAGLIELRRDAGRAATCWRSRPRRCCAPARSTRRPRSTWSTCSTCIRPTWSTPSGSTTAPAGWPYCWPAPTRCSPSTPTVRPGHWRGRALPTGIAGSVRGPGLHPGLGGFGEDPVTGSLNASLAGWLLDSGRASAPYVASQGTAMGRRGRVHISRDDDGTIWVGGGTVTCLEGTANL